MSRIHRGMIALAAPLAALAFALPAGIEATLAPSWATGLPFIWAALIVTLYGTPSALGALVLCLPFSAWSLLYCSSWALAPRPPAADALELFAAAALFLSALALARFKSRSARLFVSYAVLLPGIGLQAELGPFAALALAAFIAALAALRKPRSEARP